MQVQEFIRKWGPGGPAHALNERAGAQAHFIDLCRVLGVAEPADPDSYCFERGLTKTGSGAGRTDGFADVWLRGCFVWEQGKCRAEWAERVPQPRCRAWNVRRTPSASSRNWASKRNSPPSDANEPLKPTPLLARAGTRSADHAIPAAVYRWTCYTPAMPDYETLRRLLALNIELAAQR